MMRRTAYLILSAMLLVLAGCSTTNIPEGEQLYTGLSKINYTDYKPVDHAKVVQAEVDAALACEPNGALLGSSTIRTPFPVTLWIYNAFAGSESGVGKWIRESFGKRPVFISNVNPELRASVAQNTLRNWGYLRGTVSSHLVQQSNPKTCKVGYDVNMGNLFTLDTVRYVGFPALADSIIMANNEKAAVCQGDPFVVSKLDEERSRIASIFRNNGYYFYQSDYASYLADTISVPGRVQLNLVEASDVPEKARHPWYLGKLDIEMRRTSREQLTDSTKRRFFTVHYNGSRSPLRTRVIMRDMKVRPGQLYSVDKHTETVNALLAKGMFSSVDLRFTPRDTTSACDTLDMRLSCVLDKPYDFFIEADLRGKTNNRIGPGLRLGMNKRNAFRGGETFSIGLHGSYEMQFGRQPDGSSQEDSYEYGGEASLTIPRLVVPFLKRRRWPYTPSTILQATSNVLHRSGFFNLHTVSGALTYQWQPTMTSRHEFSPLTLQYQYIGETSDRFEEIRKNMGYTLVSLEDQFTPVMKYTYNYTSPQGTLNPINWEVSVAESGNLVSVAEMALGKGWDTLDKKLFHTPYSQFLKLATDFTKSWHLTDNSELVAHLAGGVIWSYGNRRDAPHAERFYVGGANSVRAFTARSLGPGRFQTDQSSLQYVMQTGDLKFQANLEYRFRLMDNLYGALFLDAGNVWLLSDDGVRENAVFRPQNIIRELATGTGLGIRYDLDFFVIRLDWGVGLHVPYRMEHGYFNIPSFKNCQTLNLAIGYPF